MESLNAVDLIANERRRQLTDEGWDADHDRGHANELALAASVYALPGYVRNDAWHYEINEGPRDWPWDIRWYKPTPDDRIRELVKSGALIAAAIDALLDAND